MSDLWSREALQRLAEVDAKKTVNGGWTKDDLEQWGVPWPPPKGWRVAIGRHGFPYKPSDSVMMGDVA